MFTQGSLTLFGNPGLKDIGLSGQGYDWQSAWAPPPSRPVNPIHPVWKIVLIQIRIRQRIQWDLLLKKSTSRPGRAFGRDALVIG